NHPPVINLPVSFSFNKNETLVTNFGQYISDANNDNLSLIYQAGRNLNVSVEGHIVTFSAAYNWYGTEVVTFAVNDGQATTSDSVTINVLPTDLPTWLPTVYSNNPATVFGIITINGTPADTGDQIAAFVGDECRGTGSIVINQGQAYTTLLVNLSAASESVIFKVYDASADLIYQTTSPQVLSYGQVLGDIIPHPISVSALVSLDPPVVTVEKVTQGIKLSWLPVANATRYRVFRSNNPVNGYSEIAVVTGTQHIDTQYHDCCFYKVYASDGTLNRGGVR
ncbi:MAG: hypothetical protein FJ041_02025, partial [Candidatus Cloacimonetes bacterium]|nr:hypothetical protein [Candidatus Cloacimonadota bacterium]